MGCMIKAEGGSSIEFSSSAGSVIPANVSVPSLFLTTKLKSRIDEPPTETLSSSFPACRDPIPLFLLVDGVPSLHLLSLHSSPKVLTHHSLFRLEALAD